VQQIVPPSRVIEAFGSHGVSLRLIARTDHAQVSQADFAPGALLGRHPAAGPQTLAVLSGSGWVSGGDGVRHDLAAGDLVRFDPGESHESGSDGGMIAVVVETATPAG
jgi:quercetin dioxygenase-like cupin family protein